MTCTAADFDELTQVLEVRPRLFNCREAEGERYLIEYMHRGGMLCRTGAARW